jgi:type III secretion protein R
MSRPLTLAASVAALLVPSLAFARVFPSSLGADSVAGNPLTLMGMLALLSLLPFALIMLTSFSKIAVVLSMARSAMGTQQAPPTLVLTGLAAVLTAAVMSPVMQRMWTEGQSAYQEVGTGAQLLSAGAKVVEPLREFLLKHGDPDERARFAQLGRQLRPADEASQVTEDDWFVIIPAFALTELKEAFEISFLIFLPFLVVDMVIANVLLALGMQTLSPSQVSLPFKLLLFVAVNGWSLLAQGLILGYR